MAAVSRTANASCALKHEPRPQGSGSGSVVVYYSVFRVNFMVKLLRACVWMPWRK